jgi:hypothetical protein
MTPEVERWLCDGSFVCRHGLSREGGIVVHVNCRLPAYDVLVPHEWIDEAAKATDRRWPRDPLKAALNIGIGIRCGSYTR